MRVQLVLKGIIAGPPAWMEGSGDALAERERMLMRRRVIDFMLLVGGL